MKPLLAIFFLFLLSANVYANPHLGHAIGYLTSYCTDDAPAAPPPAPGCSEAPGEPLPLNAEAGAVRLLRILPNQAAALDNLGVSHSLHQSATDMALIRGQIAIAALLLQSMKDSKTVTVEGLQEVRRLINSPNNRDSDAASELIARVLRNYARLIFDEEIAPMTYPSGVTVYRSMSGTQFYSIHTWKALQLAVWHVDDAIQFELARER